MKEDSELKRHLAYRKKIDLQWEKYLKIYEINKDKYALSNLVLLMDEYNQTDKWIIENDRDRRWLYSFKTPISP